MARTYYVTQTERDAKGRHHSYRTVQARDIPEAGRLARELAAKQGRTVLQRPAQQITTIPPFWAVR